MTDEACQHEHYTRDLPSFKVYCTVCQVPLPINYGFKSYELEKKVEELAMEYYALISSDYHKDRDCHFEIEDVRFNLAVSYGKQVKFDADNMYRVCHYGYVNRLKKIIENITVEDDSFSFNTYEEALRFLIENLERFIKREKERVRDE